MVLTGTVDVAGLAVPDRHQRLPGPARQVPPGARDRRQQREGAYLPLTIYVLRITGGTITEIITFHDDQFPRLGLPDHLSADGTE
ncbi:hypothetical protein P1P75_03150 [Streptomyces sp. ID05-39B]|uniref:hypothetical protein n=1 Tax=Streptomyces sp. ID05-39B TaxID=3028664 RepID=UPI0029B11760|nr:hypothetical protein [Streptomyces sp. ID05-39B]MDX3525454.1 hypothetical protein [Streptomyces sp. ID05-39B]